MSGVTTRLMEIDTPLGDGVLLFHGMRAREELGRLSEYQLDLLSAEERHQSRRRSSARTSRSSWRCPTTARATSTAS